MSAAAVNLLISDAYLLGGIHSVKELALVVSGGVGFMFYSTHTTQAPPFLVALLDQTLIFYMDLVVE